MNESMMIDTIGLKWRQIAGVFRSIGFDRLQRWEPDELSCFEMCHLPFSAVEMPAEAVESLQSSLNHLQ